MKTNPCRMDPTELKVCQYVITALSSKKYQSSNYLFLDPVDLTHFPTYATIVKKPMDLGTVGKNLQSGLYQSKQEFLLDLNLCFDNANTFHKDNAENAWIITLAMKMKKNINKELKVAEKKFGQMATVTPSGGGGTKKKKVPNTKTPSSNHSKTDATSIVTTTGDQNDKAPASNSNQRPKLSLKLNKTTSAAQQNTNVSTAGSSTTLQTPANTDTGSKFKFKLKLSAATSSTKPPSSTTGSQPRGKVLPAAVADTKPSAKKGGTSKSLSSNKNDHTSSSTIKLLSSSRKSKSKAADAMTSTRKAQCTKVLSALKQREEQIGWFMKPVKNLYKSIDDYQQKIPFPMDVSTMNAKLDKNSYETLAEFVLDLRRIFGNCLRYNVLSSSDSLRGIATKMLASSENFLNYFVAKQDTKGTKNDLLYPNLLYCWKSCVEILDSVLDLKNADDKLQTAWYFLHPVSFFFGGEMSEAYKAYKDKIKSPMDFGTITSNVMEGHYQEIDDFVRDCKLVTSNCKAFYQDDENGKIFTAQAERLENFLSPRLDALLQFDRSEHGLKAKTKFASPVRIQLLKPPSAFYTSMVDELRRSMYTDKYTKITEPAVFQFEDPVDISIFKDYLQYVETPMNIKTVENRINAGVYDVPEDFEYDVNLTFKNSEAYNTPKQNQHILNLSKHCAKFFKKMYSSRIKTFEASGGKKLFGDDTKRPLETSVDAATSAPPSKRVRIEPASSEINPPKIVETQSTTLKLVAKATSTTPGRRTLPRIVIRTDGPLPLHVAIAKIKEGFSIRRHHKDLQLWEEACSRFFRELKRHPWISTSKRFVFDAPVTMLHPEIKQAYAMLIKKPMDLTTAEAKLLQGGIYSGPQEFVDDVALVFSNAVLFNKGGHEQGDPTSMAYYDASKHLLRHVRWLSLEYLSEYLIDDTHSEGIRQSGSLTHWKLTLSNQSDARFERENIVITQEIEKSEEGDRFTWHETECEKLLKALRHQSDNKKMAYYVKPIFPPDYVGIISRPICWENCNEKLQRRKYETFGEIISDLRLIFSNAFKYNGRVKDSDPTSKLAYESAEYMSAKLEAAIQKLFLTAADRIEREVVEEIILSREAVIFQKAEEDRLRTEWQNERERARYGGDEPLKSTPLPSVKIIQRRPMRRDLDFDNPFTDQDDSYEQTEMNLLNKQKKRFEEQQKERREMHETTKNIGIRVYHNLFWRSQAIQWAKEMAPNYYLATQANNVDKSGSRKKDNDKILGPPIEASAISSALNNESRVGIKLQLVKPKTKRNKKRKRLFLD